MYIYVVILTNTFHCFFTISFCHKSLRQLNKDEDMLLVGDIRLGDMGSGLAKNLIKNGIATTGLDLSDTRMRAFVEMGGTPAGSVAEVGANSDAVFVMVMNGGQSKAVILGDDGLAAHILKGSAVILTATIKRSESRDIGMALEGSGIHLVNSPVSGGFPGAQGGTLTMRAAAASEVLDQYSRLWTQCRKPSIGLGPERVMARS